MSLIFHRKPRGPKGIRSDAEQERAKAQISFLQAAVEKGDGPDLLAQCREMLSQREAEIHNYEALKSGEFNFPKVTKVNEVAAVIPRLRIARGISQTELAHRLGVSKQVINRYEESGYQTVGLERLQRILEVLGVKVGIELSSSL